MKEVPFRIPSVKTKVLPPRALSHGANSILCALTWCEGWQMDVRFGLNRVKVGL